MATYYIVCWVGGDKVERCSHEHDTLGDAELCCGKIPARFIRAVDANGERSLDDEEFEVWRRLEKMVLVKV